MATKTTTMRLPDDLRKRARESGLSYPALIERGLELVRLLAEDRIAIKGSELSAPPTARMADEPSPVAPPTAKPSDVPVVERCRHRAAIGTQCLRCGGVAAL
jgi:hypothetical protein